MGMLPSTEKPNKPKKKKQYRRPLDPFFKPKTVAVIGATEKEGSVGRTLFWNLLSSPFGGTVFPVNPKRPSILGVKAYPDIQSVPEKVDLAVLVTPSPSVPDLIGQCVKAGVPSAIVISAGFKEMGKEGAQLEADLLEQAAGKIRIIGPNCLGLMNPITGLNATFASKVANRGNVGFISQSGALCTAILDWSLENNVGFSSFLSIGSMIDVGWGDLIEYLGNDPQTKSIVLYMESVGFPRRFLSAAREVSRNKPIIVIKAGRTEAAAKAAASHTGTLAGSDEVLNAAFRRSGVLRVESIADLFYMAEVLANQPIPKGPRLTILTNAGGPGVLATDALISEGGELTETSEETTAAFNEFLPPHWSHNNPIDILGDADAKRYSTSLDIAAKDPNSDGLLVILTPQAMTKPTETAQDLKEYAKGLKKPLFASWMGGPDVAAGRSILQQAGIPTLPYPDRAASVFTAMWRYAYNLRGIYETPMPLDDSNETLSLRGRTGEIVEKARAERRTLLTEFESKEALASYGIPVVETRIAHTAEEAVAAAEEIGFPVVLKIHSETLTHKTDVGGVRLGLRKAKDVKGAFEGIRNSVTEHAGAEHFLGVTVQKMVSMEGYELIVGSSIDSQFGPVLLFGTGGQLVEVFKDRSLGLPPLNTTLARRMMEQTKIYTALKGVRGRESVDMRALEELLVRFSQLVVEQKWIKEIDINPLLVSAEGIVALDARVLLHDPDVDEEDLPEVAIRPYPIEYVEEWTAKNGQTFTVRPIRPEDEPILAEFHETLSEDTVYFRYFHPVSLDQRISHQRLSKICFVDYTREVVLVAVRKDSAGKQTVAGVGRLNRNVDPEEAEFAVMMGDEFQKIGLGTEILSRLLHIAPKEDIKKVIGVMLPENRGMIHVCEKLGFAIRHDTEEKIVEVAIELEEE